MTTSFPELLQQAKTYDEAGPSGKRASDDALTAAIAEHDGAKAAEAEAEALQESLTTVQIDVQKRLNDESPKVKAGRLAAVQAFLSGDSPPDDAARQHAHASRVQNLLLDTLEQIVEVELPKAALVALQAKCATAYSRATAVRAEVISHLLNCLVAARPLVAVNGGSIDLVVNEGNSKTGALLGALHAAFNEADQLKAHLDRETAKHASNVQKLN